MKVAQLLEARQANWSELELYCRQLEGRRRTLRGSAIARFAALYRAACADLALADGYQLPPTTIEYLHDLVGRAHNQMYRSRSFQWASWGREIFQDLPRRLFRDRALRLAFVVFWGLFLACAGWAYTSPRFAEQVLGKEMLLDLEKMYSDPIDGRSSDANSRMAGFYVWNNPSIGLQCFAAGLLCGVGGLFITISNAAVLGTAFGYMATVEQRTNFFHFVTAHTPFEMTGVVLAAAAGMQLGFSLVDTGGLTRSASLRYAAREAIPAVCVSIVLFLLAAIIEGFISPSGLPYAAKALVSIVSIVLLAFYFVVLGSAPRVADAIG